MERYVKGRAAASCPVTPSASTEVSKSTCWTGVISEAEELLLRLGETDMEKKKMSWRVTEI